MVTSQRINNIFRSRPGYQLIGGNYLRETMPVDAPALAREMAN
jgi:hypothetical protein